MWDTAQLTDVNTNAVYTLMIGDNGRYIYYRLGSSGSTMYRREMTTPGDLSTLGTAVGVSVAGFANISSSYNWSLSDDGTVLMKANSSSIQYAVLSTPWDLSTMGSVQTETPTGSAIYAATMSPDGTRIYVWIQNNSGSSPSGKDGWMEGTMTTPYDISTVTWDYDRVFYIQDANVPKGFGFLHGGKIFFHCTASVTHFYRLENAGNLVDGKIEQITGMTQSFSTSAWEVHYNQHSIEVINCSPDGNSIYALSEEILMKIDTDGFDWDNAETVTGAEGFAMDYLADQVMEIEDPDSLLSGKNLQALSFSEDGQLMCLSWEASNQTTYMQLFYLPIPWDLNSAIRIDEVTQATSAENMTISPDGTVMIHGYWNSGSTMKVQKYDRHLKTFLEDTVSSVIATATAPVPNITWATNHPPAWAWSPNGDRCFFAYRDASNYLQLMSVDCGQPFIWPNSLNGANNKIGPTRADSLLTEYTSTNNVKSLWVKRDGSKLFTIPESKNYPIVFDLATNFDVSTAAYPNKTFPFGSRGSPESHVAHFMSPHGRFFYSCTVGGKITRRNVPSLEYNYGGV